MYQIGEEKEGSIHLQIFFLKTMVAVVMVNKYYVKHKQLWFSVGMNSLQGTTKSRMMPYNEGQDKINPESLSQILDKDKVQGDNNPWKSKVLRYSFRWERHW